MSLLHSLQGRTRPRDLSSRVKWLGRSLRDKDETRGFPHIFPLQYVVCQRVLIMRKITLTFVSDFVFQALWMLHRGICIYLRCSASEEMSKGKKKHERVCRYGKMFNDRLVWWSWVTWIWINPEVFYSSFISVISTIAIFNTLINDVYFEHLLYSYI